MPPYDEADEVNPLASSFFLAATAATSRNQPIISWRLYMLPLDSDQIDELYGSLRRVLHECPAAQIRSLAGAAGWDLGNIPDALDDIGLGTRRPLIEAAIDGQWAGWKDWPETRQKRLRLLAYELLRFHTLRGSADEVHEAVLKNGFRFENGDFVPVDATGKIPD